MYTMHTNAYLVLLIRLQLCQSDDLTQLSENKSMRVGYSGVISRPVATVKCHHRKYNHIEDVQDRVQVKIHHRL
jgi:hypothetical protein